MKFAASAALNGYSGVGYTIARSTQLHNAEAIKVIEAEEYVLQARSQVGCDPFPVI